MCPSSSVNTFSPQKNLATWPQILSQIACRLVTVNGVKYIQEEKTCYIGKTVNQCTDVQLKFSLCDKAHSNHNLSTSCYTFSHPLVCCLSSQYLFAPVLTGNCADPVIFCPQIPSSPHSAVSGLCLAQVIHTLLFSPQDGIPN